jgi:hypothetical protein
MADTMGLCSYSLPQNFPSATVRAKRIKAPLASFDYTSATFFSAKRQKEKTARDILASI